MTQRMDEQYPNLRARWVQRVKIAIVISVIEGDEYGFRGKYEKAGSLYGLGDREMVRWVQDRMLEEMNRKAGESVEQIRERLKLEVEAIRRAVNSRKSKAEEA